MDASYTTGHDAAALDIEIAECRANERKWRIQAERLEEQRMLLLLEEHQDPETEEPTEGANDSSVGAEEADDDDEREEELRDVWQRIAMHSVEDQSRAVICSIVYYSSIHSPPGLKRAQG